MSLFKKSITKRELEMIEHIEMLMVLVAKLNVQIIEDKTTVADVKLSQEALLCSATFIAKLKREAA